MPNSEEYFCPSSQTDWRDWLEKNHQTTQSVWFVLYKSSTQIPTISWSEAVDEALCFGWIDSTKKSMDDQRYMQYFTKRKPSSSWSKVNKEKATKLIQNHRMSKAGLEIINLAKQNGSWNSADDIEALVVPFNLKLELLKYDGAWHFFNALSKSSKKILLYWVQSAKKSETRKKRIIEIAKSAKNKLKPKQFQ